MEGIFLARNFAHNLEAFPFQWAGLGGKQSRTLGSRLAHLLVLAYSGFAGLWKKRCQRSVTGCADACSQLLMVAVRGWYCRVQA